VAAPRKIPEKLRRVVCGWPNRFRQDKGQHAPSRSGSERGTEVMGKVRTGHSTSLDGFIAGPNDGPEAPMGEGGERLLGWYFGGDTEYRLPGTEMVCSRSRRRPPSSFARHAQRQGRW
jgi:hypothetical protein